MSMPDMGPRSDKEEAAYNRQQAQQAFHESYNALEAMCEKIGTALRGERLTEETLSALADCLCDELYEDPDYRGCLADFTTDADVFGDLWNVNVYQDMEAVVIKAYKGEEK